MSNVIPPPLNFQGHSNRRIAVQREIFLALRVGHGLELVPWPVACKRGLDLGEHAKAIERVGFELF